LKTYLPFSLRRTSGSVSFACAASKTAPSSDLTTAANVSFMSCFALAAGSLMGPRGAAGRRWPRRSGSISGPPSSASSQRSSDAPTSSHSSLRVSMELSGPKLPPPSLSITTAAIEPTMGLPFSSASSAVTVTFPPGAARPPVTLAVTLGSREGRTSTAALAISVLPWGRGSAACSVSVPLAPAGTPIVWALPASAVHSAADCAPDAWVRKTLAGRLSPPRMANERASPSRTTSFDGRTSAVASRRTGTHSGMPPGSVSAPPNVSLAPTDASFARNVTCAATCPGHGPVLLAAPIPFGAFHGISASP
jgi:hypothetical protein